MPFSEKSINKSLDQMLVGLNNHFFEESVAKHLGILPCKKENQNRNYQSHFATLNDIGGKEPFFCKKCSRKLVQ